MTLESKVKKLTYALLGSLIPFLGGLQADDETNIDNQDISAEKMMADETEGSIFTFSAKGDWIQQAKIDKRTFNHNHVKYWNANAQATMIVYYDKQWEEGLALGVGYDHVYFNWNKNLYFKNKNFNDASFTVSAFSKRLCKWLWQAQATLSWEYCYKNFSDYTYYDLVLWGRYEYTCDINLHFGLYAQTGMKIDHIFPVIGFDWTISPKWKLNAIFPFNMSLVYKFNDSLSFALAGRIFNVRYRVGRNEPLTRALFEYRNKGIEFAANYDTKHFSVNLHAGYALGGTFVISDHNHKHKKHFDFDSSAYAGGEITLRF